MKHIKHISQNIAYSNDKFAHCHFHPVKKSKREKLKKIFKHIDQKHCIDK